VAAYRFAAQIIGRSSGRSATGAAAYRAGMRLTDERTGLVHDYLRKGGVRHTEILAPADAPDWMRDRAQLWNAVERAEKRKDAQLSREVLLNLPHELDDRQRLELVRGFVEQEFVALGMVADLSIHAPHREGDDRNHHAHVMLTMRALTGDGFGAKARDWNAPEQLERWRASWAQHQNRALHQAGRSERVDHRSLEAQGIDREPEPKQGPVATGMEREGRPSKAGDDRRAVQARNATRDRLKARGQVIDLALARRQRGREADQMSEREARRIDHEKGRFEAWANGQRALLQNARLDAEGALGRAQYAERMALQERQATTYGAHAKEVTAALDAIAERQERSKGLRGILYRLTGRASADSTQAEALRATLTDIRQRVAEQAGALTSAQAEATRQAGQRASQAAAALEARIAEAHARRDAEGWKSQPVATPTAAGNTPQEAGLTSSPANPTQATPEATHGPENAPDATGAGGPYSAEYLEAFHRLSAKEANRSRGQGGGGRER